LWPTSRTPSSSSQRLTGADGWMGGGWPVRGGWAVGGGLRIGCKPLFQAHSTPHPPLFRRGVQLSSYPGVNQQPFLTPSFPLPPKPCSSSQKQTGPDGWGPLGGGEWVKWLDPILRSWTVPLPLCCSVIYDVAEVDRSPTPGGGSAVERWELFFSKGLDPPTSSGGGREYIPEATTEEVSCLYL